MFLTNKKRGFYTAKSCSKVGRDEACERGGLHAGFWESVNDLFGRTLLFPLIFFVCLIPVSALAFDKGEAAPGFTLKDVRGQEVSLKDFKGRTVLLKLGTTWCPTCKQLSADIDKLGDFLNFHEVVVLEVFVQDSPAMVEKFVGDTQHPMTFHALLDDGQAYRGYNVYLIPRLLVIDADQVVQFDSEGRDVTSEKIVQLVKALPPPVESSAPPRAKE